MMEALLKVPVDQRDEGWEQEFFKLLPKTSFELLGDTPMEGPDGMPYLVVKTVEQGESGSQVLDWLGEKGVGLVVNPKGETPDYVFSYGMIWNFLANGEFLTPMENSSLETGEMSLKAGEEMMAGTPNETYLPSHVRALFREFLGQQGVTKPRIVMLSQDSVNYDLCFSLESLGHPPEDEWQGILEGFSWFFPLHYSFSIISEEMIQGIEFIDL